MKPRELAMILKSEYSTSLPSQPAGLKPLLEDLELYPHSYSPQQIHTLTASIMHFLRFSNTAPFSLPEPSSSNSSRRHPVAELPSQLVLQGLTAFREEFLKHDPGISHGNCRKCLGKRSRQWITCIYSKTH